MLACMLYIKVQGFVCFEGERPSEILEFKLERAKIEKEENQKGGVG